MTMRPRPMHEDLPSGPHTKKISVLPVYLVVSMYAIYFLGGFHVRDIYSGVEFDIGTGFTLEQRKNLWDAWQKNPKHLLGHIVKYKHFPVGVVDKPRHPIFLGFRDRRDM